MAALRFGLKCSRTNVYAPLSNQIDALPSNTIWGFETISKWFQNPPKADKLQMGKYLGSIFHKIYLHDYPKRLSQESPA